MFWSLRVLTGSLLCQHVGGGDAASTNKLSGAPGSSIEVHKEMLALSFCIE